MRTERPIPVRIPIRLRFCFIDNPSCPLVINHLAQFQPPISLMLFLPVHLTNRLLPHVREGVGLRPLLGSSRRRSGKRRSRTARRRARMIRFVMDIASSASPRTSGCAALKRRAKPACGTVRRGLIRTRVGYLPRSRTEWWRPDSGTGWSSSDGRASRDAPFHHLRGAPPSWTGPASMTWTGPLVYPSATSGIVPGN